MRELDDDPLARLESARRDARADCERETGAADRDPTRGDREPRVAQVGLRDGLEAASDHQLGGARSHVEDVGDRQRRDCVDAERRAWPDESLDAV